MTSPGSGAESRGALRFRDLSGRQRVLLFGVVLLVPLVLAAVAEGALRVAGYGGNYPLFVPHERDASYLVPNPEVGRRYFVDPQDAPRPHADLLERDKAPGTYRVVVQGASSAAGFPYYFGGSFSRMLRQRLRETFPDRRIEVVNVALDATNSYAIDDLVDEVVAVDPDAVLLYAGHNEFYGTFGVASSESIGRFGPVVRAYLDLRRLRLVQLLRDVLARGRAALAGGDGSERSATLMERLAGDRAVRFGSPLHQAGVEQFRDNLDRILGRYRDEGIPVLVGTLASNERDLPPFVSRPAGSVDTAAWSEGLAAARAAQQPAAAVAALDDLVARDSLAPLPHYLRARALEASGDSAAAAEAYLKARDYDQLPFRASRPFDEVIREVAARHGATVVETRERLAQASPGRVLGDELLLEHVHPRVEGQLLLADAFYEALRTAGAIGTWEGWVPLDSARTRIPVTAADTLAGALWIDALTAGFPFTTSGEGLPVGRGDTMTATTPLEAIALGMYRGELPWPEGQRRLYTHYLESGELESALHVARVLADELPLWEGAHLMVGRAAWLLGRDDEARRALLTADGLRPTEDAALLLGGLLASGGDRERARPYFDRVARAAGQGSREGLALRAFDAIPELEARAAEEPGDADAWTDLAGTYLLTAQYDRAIRAAEKALDADPGSAEAASILEQARSARPTGRPGHDTTDTGR